MKKKVVSLLLVTAMAVTAFAGCGKKTTAADLDTPVEITSCGKVLNIFCWNEEFKSRVEDHYPGYEKTDATSGKPIELTNAFATITADTNNKTSLIVNRKPAVLPSTGGSGIYFYIIVGGAIAGAAAYFITKTKKEEKQLS